MKEPGKPANEDDRLAALRSYDLLDSPPEQAFDTITRLAATSLGVPIALVSLVDESRQWFKSRVGLEAAETPRGLAFCAHVVADDGPLVVPDAREDERFADNPLVTGDPLIRFYAGVPLRTPEGFVLGTLCTLDHRPRKIDPTELQLLSLLAAQVMDQLELRRQGMTHRRERARLNAVLDGMQEGVVVQEPGGRIVDANPAAHRILGLTPDQMFGRTSFDPRWRSVREDGSPFPGSDHPSMVALATGEPVRDVVMGVHHPDGTLRWISVNAQPVVENGVVTSVITTFRDTTEARRAQRERESLLQQISRQERLATVGTLAAGIGHEINNPLTSVLGNLECAIEELRSLGATTPPVLPTVEMLEEARAGAETIRKSVQGLKDFARPPAEREPVDLLAASDLAIRMARHELRSTCTVVTDLSPGTRVLAEQAGLTQVLVHLLVNAARSFTDRDPVHNRILVRAERRRDGAIQVDVEDNGPGIPEHVLPRIFDPFFTTRPVGEGTGLGLSMCHEILTANDGTLTCTSAPGRGTTFRLVLPGVPPQAAPIAAGTPVAGRVLLVDDEVAVLRSVGRLLGKAHEVVTIHDPREALHLIEAGARFDVVFCDLMMPHLDGTELYQKVQEICPELAERFVFLTGGARSADVRRFLSSVSNPVLDKPIDSARLRALASRYASQTP